MLQLHNEPMSLLDADDEELDRQNHEERELTLSTGAILGLFFGLVLLCGLFFGFGYKMGSHKTVQTIEAAATEGTSPSANFGAFKPAAGSPAGGGAPTPSARQSAAAEAPAPRPAAAESSDATPAAPPSAAPLVHTAPPPPPRTIPAPPTAAPVATGSFVVQVAAVSHQEDADLLVGALKAKGYPAAARSEPQDKLFHIHVGPYTNRKDADAIRQRLLSEGYNPIVK